MTRLITILETINSLVGRGIAWTALIMVIVQFWVVILRYVFAIGSIPVQESIWYLHGILFMVGAGYTLLKDGHVRIDVWYRETPVRKKAWVNLLGVIFLLMPVLILAWRLALPYVLNSWRVMESSTEAGGLPFIYLLKTVILIGLGLLAVQGTALALRSVLVLQGHEEAFDTLPGGGKP